MTKDRRNSVKHWENEDDEKEMERLKRAQRQRRRASEFVKDEAKSENASRSSQFVLPLAIAIIVSLDYSHLVEMINFRQSLLQFTFHIQSRQRIKENRRNKHKRLSRKKRS